MTSDDRDHAADVAARVLAERRASFRIFADAGEVGEQCLAHIEFLGYVYRSAVAQDINGHVDPYILAYREGRRSLALEIRSHVAALKGGPRARQERAQTALAEG